VRRIVERVFEGVSLARNFGPETVAAGAFHLPGKSHRGTKPGTFGTTWRVDRGTIFRDDGLYRVVIEVFLWEDARGDAYDLVWKRLVSARSFAHETARRLMEDLVRADDRGDDLAYVVRDWDRVPRPVGARSEGSRRVLRQ